MLRGGSGRHYIGLTSNLELRLEQHRRGQTHTTKRLGGDLELVASKPYNTREEAAVIEAKLKGWKSPAKAREFLESAG